MAEDFNKGDGIMKEELLDAGLILKMIVVVLAILLFSYSYLLSDNPTSCGIEQCTYYNYQDYSTWADGYYGVNNWDLKEVPYCDKNGRPERYQGMFYEKHKFSFDFCNSIKLYGAVPK
jgi:hypothetical protein